MIQLHTCVTQLVYTISIYKSNIIKQSKMTKTSRKTSRKPHAETTKDPRFNVSP
jgi:hypothetical protein